MGLKRKKNHDSDPVFRNGFGPKSNMVSTWKCPICNPMRICIGMFNVINRWVRFNCINCMHVHVWRLRDINRLVPVMNRWTWTWTYFLDSEIGTINENMELEPELVLGRVWVR